jgi:hypothetical protein
MLKVEEISTPLHIKFSKNEELQYCQIVERIRRECKLSEIEAIEEIREPLTSGEITVDETSALLKFYINRNISQFEQRQKRLQEAWLHADEVKELNVLHDETKELEKLAVVLKTLEQEEKEREKEQLKGDMKQQKKQKNNRPRKIMQMMATSSVAAAGVEA